MSTEAPGPALSPSCPEDSGGTTRPVPAQHPLPNCPLLGGAAQHNRQARGFRVDHTQQGLPP